jgi:hypothetical protein
MTMTTTTSKAYATTRDKIQLDYSNCTGLFKHKKATKTPGYIFIKNP